MDIWQILHIDIERLNKYIEIGGNNKNFIHQLNQKKIKSQGFILQALKEFTRKNKYLFMGVNY